MVNAQTINIIRFITAAIFLSNARICNADHNLLRASSSQVVNDSDPSHPNEIVSTNNTSSSISRSLSFMNQDSNEQLVMHTFFQRIDPELYHKYGGMDDQSDADLILTWEAAWRAAGWKTRVVTLEDARKHPNYEKFDKLLDLEKMPFGYYDKLCFLRWLAMAAVGGGFMSDYDTFPLLRFAPVSDIPRGGKLTVYDRVREGGVPSVVSGSADEFDRIAHQLLYNALQVGVRKDFWSDMMALMDVHKKNRDEYLLFDQVLKGNVALAGRSNGLSNYADCKAVVGGNFAVHFSHFAITAAVEKGHLDASNKASDRPKIADQFMKDWASSCRQLLAQEYYIGG